MASPRKNEAVWARHNETLLRSAQEARALSDQVRVETSRLHRTTSAHLQRTAREVQATLALRIDDVEQKRADLEQTLADVRAETEQLSRHAEHVRGLATATAAPLSVTTACQALRAQRQQPDLVDDAVDAALRSEAATLAHSRATAEEAAEDCTEQLRRLKAINRALDADLVNKFEAYDIDTRCATLDHTSRGLGFNPGITQRAQDNTVTPDNWRDFSDRNMADARREIASSVALRERIDLLQKTNAAAEAAAANAVEGASNTRIAQYTDARDAALTHLKKLRLEFEAQSATVASLESAIFEQEAPLMLSQTRLTNRTRRPSIELVHDPAQRSLVTEITAIEGARETLGQQLDRARAAHRALARSIAELETDAAVKTHSLNLENQAMQKRQQFKYRLVGQ